jgi:hypothetical protein
MFMLVLYRETAYSRCKASLCAYFIWSIQVSFGCQQSVHNFSATQSGCHHQCSAAVLYTGGSLEKVPQRFSRHLGLTLGRILTSAFAAISASAVVT